MFQELYNKLPWVAKRLAMEKAKKERIRDGEKCFDDIASAYTRMFIWGATNEEQLEVFKKRDKYLVLRTDHSEQVLNARLKYYGFNPDEPTNLMSVHMAVFRQNRGSFEKEKEAVLSDLKFWFKIKED